jgi:tripartite-type tricarboxylate transporter receptor subunit TctC
MANKMKISIRVALMSLSLGWPMIGLAQSYPSKPVVIVAPFSPGGGTDTGTRIVAQQLNRQWNQSVIVENRAGAAGIVGVDYVARSAPDGYRLLMGNVGTQSINPSLYKNLPYNADTAFAPISLVAELPAILVVNPALPVRTVKDLVTLAERRPGELLYSSSGGGQIPHLAAVLFENLAKVKLTHVPYKGGGPAVQDLIGGHVQLSFPTILAVSSFIRAGRLRALGVTSTTRSPTLPDVPTLSESGLARYDCSSWIGLLAPVGTPGTIITKIANDLREVVRKEETTQRLVGQGATPVGSTPAEFKTLMESERLRYARMIAERGIELD